METVQKISTRILVPAVTATIIFSLGLFFIAGSTLNRLAERNLIRIAQSKVSDINISEKRVAGEILAQASLFSRAEGVLKAYDTAYGGDLNNADDPRMEWARQELREYFMPIEKGYQAVYPGKSLRLHFHVPPARSLLRLWKKNQHKSDDLSAFRDTVLTISKGGHQPITGIEIGRGGFVIRGIAPIFSPENKYLGSVEALSSFDPIVKYSVSNDKEYLAVYMNKEFLPIATQLQNPSKNPSTQRVCQ